MVRLINVPFCLLSLPSYEVASIKAYLNEHDIDVFVDNIYINIAEHIQGDIYRILRTTNIGEMIFASMLDEEIYNNSIDIISEKLKKYNLDYYQITSLLKSYIMSYIRELNCYDKYYGFYIYTQQLYTALYFSKIIKIERPDSRIIFMGYNCQDMMGVSLKKTFEWIDIVIQDNVEERLLAYLKNTEEIIHDNLDFLPSPDYSDFFRTLKSCSSEFIKEYLGQYALQLEVSRGCYWNKCCFCTYNCNSPSFREKSLKNIERDFRELQTKYQTVEIVLNQLAPESKWKQTLELLYNINPIMLKKMSYNFKVETLSKPEDFKLLAKFGVSILVGTESFSFKYLKKLNKNQRVIDNIFVLKFAERYNLPLYHNLLYGFPFEDNLMYSESMETISFIYHLQPPFDLEKFRLTYGSDVYMNPKKYNVKSIFPRYEVENAFLTMEMKKHFIPFFYDYDSTGTNIEAEKWESLIEEWRRKYYSYSSNGMPKKDSLLYMVYNDEVLHIHDMRYSCYPRLYTFYNTEKQVYHFCDTIKTYSQILSRFSNVSESRISKILKDFVSNKIMFKEDDCYLSLSI